MRRTGKPGLLDCPNFGLPGRSAGLSAFTFPGRLSGPPHFWPHLWTGLPDRLSDAARTMGGEGVGWFGTLAQT